QRDVFGKERFVGNLREPDRQNVVNPQPPAGFDSQAIHQHTLPLDRLLEQGPAVIGIEPRQIMVDPPAVRPRLNSDHDRLSRQRLVHDSSGWEPGAGFPSASAFESGAASGSAFESPTGFDFDSDFSPSDSPSSGKVGASGSSPEGFSPLDLTFDFSSSICSG